MDANNHLKIAIGTLTFQVAELLARVEALQAELEKLKEKPAE